MQKQRLHREIMKEIMTDSYQLVRRLGQCDLIDGESMKPTRVLDGDVVDANSGAVLDRQRGTDPLSVERAIDAARRVHDSGAWSSLGSAGRRPYLDALAEELRNKAETIAVADAVTTGVPIGVTRLVAGSLAGAMTHAFDVLEKMTGQRDTDGRRVHADRIARGPAVILVPWNAPVGIATGKIAYGLAVGCPVIVKAPEWAPLSCSVIADAARAAGLPPGVFQLVHGGPMVGQLLVENPAVRVVSFTGSTATGRLIASVVAGRLASLQLELSGNNAAVVMADADLDETARHLVSGFTKLNGQWCEAPRRVYVPAALQEDLVASLSAELAKIRIGSSLDPLTTFGPLVNRHHAARIKHSVAGLRDAGATVLPVGEIPDQGSFFAPTLVCDVAHERGADEVFGPVLKIHSVSDEDAAIAQANDTDYGLAGYVFGADVEMAMRAAGRLRVGEVKVNGTSLLNLAPGVEQDFFGASGLGAHGDEANVRLFSGARTRGVDDPRWPL